MSILAPRAGMCQGLVSCPNIEKRKMYIAPKRSLNLGEFAAGFCFTNKVFSKKMEFSKFTKV
jgi:hypothetical protein